MYISDHMYFIFNAMISFSGQRTSNFVIMERKSRKENSRCFCTYLAKEIRNWIREQWIKMPSGDSRINWTFSLDMVCMVLST